MLLKTHKKSSLYLKFLGFLIKKGKKTKTKFLLMLSFFKFCFFFKKPLKSILNTLFITLNTFVETKTIKIKKSRYIVPFPINLNRRIHLIIKWFVLSINANKSRRSFHLKFLEELNLVLTKKHSEVLNLKNLNISKAVANRSNAHYRW